MSDWGYHLNAVMASISKLWYSSGRRAYALGATHTRRHQGRVRVPGVARVDRSRLASPQQGASAWSRHSIMPAPGVARAYCSRQASLEHNACARRCYYNARRLQSSMFPLWHPQGA
ncbi:hypothetical protein DFP73DRAFT_599686 [Morchella snyderi]|nr:hypothetical protein DFP73DRAFT_599686 [Morchella snyderi]